MALIRFARGFTSVIGIGMPAVIWLPMSATTAGILLAVQMACIGAAILLTKFERAA